MATAEKVESKNEKASVKNIGQLNHTAVEEIAKEEGHELLGAGSVPTSDGAETPRPPSRKSRPRSR